MGIGRVTWGMEWSDIGNGGASTHRKSWCAGHVSSENGSHHPSWFLILAHATPHTLL
jgi:hypothetical protein